MDFATKNNNRKIGRAASEKNRSAFLAARRGRRLRNGAFGQEDAATYNDLCFGTTGTPRDLKAEDMED